MTRYSARRIQKKRNRINTISEVIIGIGIAIMISTGESHTPLTIIEQLLMSSSIIIIGVIMKLLIQSLNKFHSLNKWLNK